jgi:hypothetical protein
MYAQKMSNEIRNLEDQLYDADYQNRVLRDRLESCRNQKDCDCDPESDSGSQGSRMFKGRDVGSGLEPAVMPEPPFDAQWSGPDSASDQIEAHSYDPMEHGLGTEALDAGEFGMVEIDSGEVVPPSEAIEPSDLKSDQPKSKDDFSVRGSATEDDSEEKETAEKDSPLKDPPLKDAPAKDPAKSESKDTGETKKPKTASPKIGKPKATQTKPDAFLLPPAPTEPQPPGKRDLIAPPLIPGEIIPPGELDAEEIPPGKIELPDSVRDNSPVDIQIHPTFSGGVPDETGKVEEMTIVVNAVDADGKPVDLEKFDIQANLTIIVMDPELPVGKDKLGRWDFTPAQTATMVQSGPVSGLHVPIRWGDLRPSSEEVVVHARLRSDGQTLHCHGRVGLQKVAQVSSLWTPRAK